MYFNDVFNIEFYYAEKEDRKRNCFEKKSSVLLKFCLCTPFEILKR